MGNGDRILDEDTARAVNAGRDAVGIAVGAARQRLQVVFGAFVVGLLAGYVAMRQWVWPFMEQSLITNPHVSVIYQTPFDVFLFQAKVGLFTGVCFALPVLGYYAREPLRRRGVVPDVSIPWWKVALLGLAAFCLLALGMGYAYLFFFPLLLSFLAHNSTAASLKPMYSIVMWTRFVLYLTLSFGIVSEVPFVMGGLSYAGIVPYETFRRYWKHTFVVIWFCGAIFTPPDVFTQTLWAVPVSVLYALSMYVSKLATTVRRGTERVTSGSILLERWNQVAGVAAVGAALGYAAAQFGLGRRLAGVGLPAAALAAPSPFVAAAVVGTVGAILGALYAVYAGFAAAAARETEADDGREPRPETLDVSALDVAGVRDAPEERFAAMDEEESLELANEALEAGRREKAAAILDRFDAAEAPEGTEPDRAGESGSRERVGGGGASGLLASTGAGMLEAFTDETDGDDVGGYYREVASIASDLRTQIAILGGWFLVVLAATFYYLYTSALGRLKRNFLSQLPRSIVGHQALHVVTLHPVEALVFEAEFSIVLAAILSVPVGLFLAWPTLRERGVIRAPRRTVWVWVVGLVGALVAGSALGYFYVAPYTVSWLVVDAHQSNMIVSYRVSDFLWLVFLTTMGIGLFADVPVAMWLLYLSDMVSFSAMYRRWRAGVLGCLVVAAVVTPNSVYTMLVVALPLAAAFLFGLGVLYLVTLGGRRERGGDEATA